MAYDGILFDFDGVIADTEPVHWNCWQQALAPYGIELAWEDYCRVCRGIAPSSMREALLKLSPSVARVSDLESRYHAAKEAAFATLADRMPIHPDTVQLLKEIRGLRLGLVTTAARRRVEPVLERAGIDNVFHVRVYGEDVGRPKPAPDAYLLGGQRLAAAHIVVFEDTAAGAESARAAGYGVVLVEDCSRLASLVRRTLAAAR